VVCPVSSMRDGQWGELIKIDGGAELTEKLASLGIRTGSRIGRKYGLVGRGPVVLTVGTGEVAIGYGMASRMMVRLEGRDNLCRERHTGFGFMRGRRRRCRGGGA
jgi:Fe2+ transport system protein FeoA